MAVGVDVVQTQLTKLLAQTEATIDLRLREAASKMNVSRILYISTRDLQTAAVEALVPKYRNAGWQDVSVYADSASFAFNLSDMISRALNTQTTSVVTPEIVTEESGRRINLK